MHLEVAAALILNDAGEVLCVKRGASKFASTAFKWEFPGGKLESGETPAQAVVREIAEELAITVEAITDAPIVEHTYPEFSITLHGIVCVQTDARPLVLREHIEATYCLPDRLWALDFAEADRPLLRFLKEKAFGSVLKTQTFGRSVHFLDSCVSTNNELLRLAEAGAPEGTLVVSEVQSGGKGRLGRTWLSEPGQGLLFSFLVRPTLP
ncbi:MAG: NUDIX domain-containing protein, partial [Kiritimatiellae bacterium]|nr:NUDIX domain-containing protein [Kiritimatiellia bacterium]